MLLCVGPGLSACVLNPDRLPRTYLLQAQQAVKAHDAPNAVAALDRAQTLWLSGNNPALARPFGYDPTALRNMGGALEAVKMGRWGDAEYYVRTAIAQPSVVTPG
jgi:hypothetical protein